MLNVINSNNALDILSIILAAVRNSGNSGKLPLPVVSDVAIYNLIIKMQMDNMNYGQPLARVVCPLLGVWHMFYRYKKMNIY